MEKIQSAAAHMVRFLKYRLSGLGMNGTNNLLTNVLLANTHLGRVQ